ncbi:hypothetical protein [Alteromonas oceanisediminis]|uniref:hypothetical protein n=1 Tax=Alteromonas oceanisediminis TaxID=2836180 RepID=UPI001BDAC4BC|nr:hypothetical protein [Alteromonas oceanisediminis]MBT0586145.1 hypothetical protein [Alteromonas oceanisediminis]
MKSKLLISLFFIALFISGGALGLFVGVSGAAGSNVNQVFSGAVELAAISELIERKEYTEAQQFTCRSLKTRMAIMDAAKPFLGSRKLSETDALSNQVLLSNFEGLQSSLGRYCE